MTIESADEFLRLRHSDDPEEYHRAAWEPASVEVWLELIRLHPDSRVWVAHNKTIPTEIVSILADDEDPAVRFTIAGKRRLGPGMLERLAADPDESIRLQIARHRNTPRRVLEILSKDRWATVAAVAEERLIE